MSEKISIAEAAVEIDQEGFGYAIMDHIGSDHIEDPELAKLWENAKWALKKVELFFEQKLGKNWQTVCYQQVELFFEQKLEDE